MKSPWYVIVGGSEEDLARLRRTGDHDPRLSLEEEAPNEWRLRSATLGSGVKPEDARTGLQDLLVRLSDVAAAAGYARVRVVAGALGLTREDGTGDLWVFPETIRSRVQAFPPTISVGGVVPESLESKLLRLGESNEHLRLALHFLNADLSWFNLWKSYEAIRDANGGTGTSLVVSGWTTDADVERFRRTANTYAASGDDARHATLEEQAPPNPMSLEAADDYVRGMLLRWIDELT